MLDNAIKANRAACRRTYGHTDLSLSTITQKSYDLWTMYPDTGTLLSMVEEQLSSEQLEEATTMKVNLDTYMSQQIPAFITGKTDVNDDAAWQSYIDGLSVFDPDSYCDAINEVLGK